MSDEGTSILERALTLKSETSEFYLDFPCKRARCVFEGRGGRSVGGKFGHEICRCLSFRHHDDCAYILVNALSCKRKLSDSVRFDKAMYFHSIP